MVPAGEVFCDIVQGIFRRFCAQNAQEPPAESVRREVAGRLWALIGERGLPAPLSASEQGSPGELPHEECEALVVRVLGEAAPAYGGQLTIPVRQLVKACFHPEFKKCRDSFREVSPDGTCRRQQTDRACLRVSGSHCVDCPYWVELTPAVHVKFLTREWQEAGRGELAAQLDIFLPEDFRQLRRLLYAKARGSIQA